MPGWICSGGEPRRESSGEPCRGAVTAEFAVALPAVVLLLAMLLAGSAAGVTQLRFEEAARGGARALARGADAAEVGGIVRRLAGESARSALASDGEWLSVTISGGVPGPVGSLVPWTLTARAWARGEAASAAAAAPMPEAPSHRPLRRSA
ncbi:TadE family type IV pilus minor pilin [Pseudarthrobacter sp. S9]|uniref:TadE family type IV pilus minor pilin n=1 Tax=Pseudarthrobacter sp. S9 TaxID=3418421 RepID=UPI003D05C9E3